MAGILKNGTKKTEKMSWEIVLLQTQDKEKGLIVGKRVYDNVPVGFSLVTTYVDTWHVLRADIKEGRARVILSLTEYEKEVADGD